MIGSNTPFPESFCNNHAVQQGCRASMAAAVGISLSFRRGYVGCLWVTMIAWPSLIISTGYRECIEGREGGLGIFDREASFICMDSLEL